MPRDIVLSARDMNLKDIMIPALVEVSVYLARQTT